MKNMLVDKEHFLYKLKRISIVRDPFLLVKQGEVIKREITFHKGEIVPYSLPCIPKKYLFFV